MEKCSFCGTENIRYEFSSSQGYITCDECGCSGPCVDDAADPLCDVEAAWDAWNTWHQAMKELKKENPIENIQYDDDQIVDLLQILDGYCRDVDHHEYGLPSVWGLRSNDELQGQIKIVKEWLNKESENE